MDAEFTKNIAIHLLNSIAEAITTGDASKVDDGYNRVIDFMEHRRVEFEALSRETQLCETAIELILFLNTETNDFDAIKRKYQEEVSKYKDKDFVHMSNKELGEYGFAEWMPGSGLMLIPIWVYDLLPDGTEIKNIAGPVRRKGDEIIMETRFGKIPYGLDRSDVK